MPTVPPLRRRTVLQVAGITALTLLSGCTGDDDGPDPPGAKGSEPDPDLELLARAISEKQDLLATYEYAVSAQSQLASRLKPMRADHAAHLAALTGFRPDLPTADASASPRPSSNPGPAIPAGRDEAVEFLAKAELAAAGRRVGQCKSARDPELARLLASIGGCEAAHTAVLRAGRSA